MKPQNPLFSFAVSLLFSFGVFAAPCLSQSTASLIVPETVRGNTAAGVLAPERAEANRNGVRDAGVISPATIVELESLALEIVNQKRREGGLQPFAADLTLQTIARLHSENMAKNNFFSHFGQDGTDVGDRAELAGLTNWLGIAENISRSRGFDDPVERAIDKWMRSEGHRENLLSSRWRETGIGIAVAGDGTFYITQVFVRRK